MRVTFCGPGISVPPFEKGGKALSPSDIPDGPCRPLAACPITQGFGGPGVLGAGTDEMDNLSGKLTGSSVLALTLAWLFPKVPCVLSMKVFGL